MADNGCMQKIGLPHSRPTDYPTIRLSDYFPNFFINKSASVG
jgi:hypothetical protein